MNATQYLWALPDGWHARLSNSKQKFYFWHDSDARKTQWTPPNQDLDLSINVGIWNDAKAHLYWSLLTFCKEAAVTCLLPYSVEPQLVVGQVVHACASNSMLHVKSFRELEDLKPKSFASVVCLQGLETSANCLETLQRMKHCMKDKGKLLLCIQNAFSSIATETAKLLKLEIVRSEAVPDMMAHLGYMQWTDESEVQRTRNSLDDLQTRHYAMDSRNWNTLYHWTFAAGFRILLFQS